MELLGDRNWWVPRWLDRDLPRMDIEGRDEDQDVSADEGAERTLEPVA
jgi:RND superfamily putative drug exporter